MQHLLISKTENRSVRGSFTERPGSLVPRARAHRLDDGRYRFAGTSIVRGRFLVDARWWHEGRNSMLLPRRSDNPNRRFGLLKLRFFRDCVQIGIAMKGGANP